MLEAAEAASSVEAVGAGVGELGRTLGATRVSFLIADLSGRSLVRLTVTPDDPERPPRPAVPGPFGPHPPAG